MNTLRKNIFGAVILGLVAFSSCSKKDGQTIVCTRTPSFPVFVSENTINTSGNISLLLIDTLSGNIVDSMVINPAIKTSILENGNYVRQFDVNENERLFATNIAAQFYLVFADKNGKADTIKNLTWHTTYPKVGCPFFTDFSFIFRGQTITDPYYNSSVYILE